MRNLKKILALVLALMMVLSVMVTASAASFTDADEINADYTEAVEVLSALGVIDGFKAADGSYSFQPNGTLTRAQAAKIVSYILVGNLDDIEDLAEAVTLSFTDVPNWAQPYVAYCYNEGIINGRNATTYDPNGNVTGYELGKMLLIAAGVCDADDFATDWKVVVAAELKDAGIWASEFKLSKELTREEACYLALNAMMVGEKVEETYTGYEINAVSDRYASGTYASATIGKVYTTFAVADTAAKAAGGATKDNVAYTYGATGDYTITTVEAVKTYIDPESTLMMGVFGADCDTTYDEFGRPTTVWFYETGVAAGYDAYDASYVLAYFTATPVISSTSAITANELYSKLGVNTALNANYSTVTDTQSNPGYLYINGSNDDNNVNVSTNTYVLGGNGIVTEVYYIERISGVKQYGVVQIVPTLAQVAGVSKTAADKTHGEYTTYLLNNGTSYNVYNTVVNPYTDYANVKINGEITRGDYVLYYDLYDGTYASTRYGFITPAKLVTGTVSAYNSATDAVTIGGTAYVKSGVADATSAGTSFDNYAAPATFALDTYGNVIGSVTVTLPTNYVFALSAATASYLNTTTNKVVEVAEVVVIDVNGDLKTITVGQVDSTYDTPASIAAAVSQGMYTYSINPVTGAYTLTAATDYTVSDAGDHTWDLTGTDIVTNKVELTTGLNGSLYANANTVFCVAQKNAYSVYSGVTTYTGIANVPSLDLSTSSVVAAAIDANDDSIAEIVFIDSTTEAYVAVNYAFLTGSYTANYLTSTYTHDGYVAGASTQIVRTAAYSTPGLYVINADGTATQKTAAADVATAPVLTIGSIADGIYGSDTYLTYNNGLLVSASDVYGTGASVICGVGANVPVYTFQNGVCTTGTAAELAAANGSVIVLGVTAGASGGYVSAIYIVK